MQFQGIPVCRWWPPATCTCTCARAGACRTRSPRSAWAGRSATPAPPLGKRPAGGLQWRFPGGAPAPVRELVGRELALIAELGYEAFFLTVHDVVQFARSRGI